MASVCLESCCSFLLFLICEVCLILLISVIISFVASERLNQPAEYSLAVAALTGLDAPELFNLMTVHVTSGTRATGIRFLADATAEERHLPSSFGSASSATRLSWASFLDHHPNRRAQRAATPWSVSVAGGNGSLAVPALFNLTVHLKNPSRWEEACVPRDTMAVVWFNGSVVAACTVPTFCAGTTDEREAVVPVWGTNAEVPRALQRTTMRRRCGEGPDAGVVVVDVAFRMPLPNS